MQETEEKQIIVNAGGGNRSGGMVALIIGGGAALGIGYAANKAYQSWKDSNDKKKQTEAAKNSGDPDYITAQSLASLFDLGWYRLGLSADEKQQYRNLFAQIKDQAKAHDLYHTITKGRSLDDDVAKWISAAVVKNTQTQQTANVDKLSTWKTDNSGSVFSTVKPADLIVIKKGNSYFKWFKYFGTATAPDYKKISQNINDTFGKNGDSVVKYTAPLYVGNHIFAQTVYFKDSAGTNRAQQKLFAYVYGANGITWGYVDLFEFERNTPLSGLIGLGYSRRNINFNLMIS